MAEMDDPLKIFREYRDYIKHEDTLRGARTGWLLTSQGFLFAAQGALLGQTNTLAVWTQPIVAVLGLAVALIAMSRANVQDRVYASIEEAYKRHGVTGLPNLRFGTAPFSPWRQYALSYALVFILTWALFLVLLVIVRLRGLA